MKRFFRYKDNEHDIKLLHRFHNGRDEYIPVGGLNDYSKRWFKVILKNEYSSGWKNIEPYIEVRSRFDARAFFPRNKPCIK